MAIFDQIIGGLTGERSLRRVRDRSIEATRQMYDPSQLDPMADVARRQATQGIDEERYRRPVLNRLFRPVMDASAFGGNQAAAIAGTATADAGRAQALAGFESELMGQDVAARQAGAAQLGAVQAQQNQMSAMGRAMTGQIRAEFEAEKDMRRRQLATSAVKFGIQAAGGAGAIGDAIGGKLSNLFRGNEALSKLAADAEAARRGIERFTADKNLPIGTMSDDTFFDFNASVPFLPDVKSEAQRNGFIGVDEFSPFAGASGMGFVSGNPFPSRENIPGKAVPEPNPVTTTPPTVSTPGASTITNPFVNPYRPNAGVATRQTQTPPTPELIMEGKALPRRWSPTQGVERFIAEAAEAVGQRLNRLYEATRSTTRPIALESIQNNPQVERQLVGIIKNQPIELLNYSKEVQRYLLYKYPDLVELFQ